MPLTQVSSRLIEDTLRYVLGANGSSDYTFTGPGLSGAVNDPTLTLSRGHTYVFENRNSSGAHPFYIKTSIANGGTNDAYNTGVTNNGGAGGTEIVFTVPHDAPDTLYYQCSSHSSMAGQLNIAGSVADGSITTAKLAADAVDGTKIADDAVTADKLANSINTAIAANTAKDLTALSASNLTSGTVPDARFPATLPAASGANLTNLPPNRVNRNLIINGAMQVSQRGSSFSNVSNNSYTLDRFILFHTYGSTQMNVINSSQSPDGFSKSYKIDVNVADTSIGSGQYAFIAHRIEAQNLQQLSYGTSGAKSLTISFYVRSTTTGTYALSIQQADNSSKQVSATYTINSADTWERKTFTFAGDTSGVINNDNGTGLNIYWHLVAGSNFNSGTARSAWTAYADADSAAGHTANILSSTSNNFHLTGVQLEVGSVATDFEHLSFQEDYLKCARYYIQMNRLPVMSNRASGHCSCTTRFNPVPMRAIPSVSLAGTLSFNSFFYGGGTPTTTNAPGFQNNGDSGQPYGGDNMILNFSGFGPSNVFQTNEMGEVYGTTIKIDAEL